MDFRSLASARVMCVSCTVVIPWEENKLKFRPTIFPYWHYNPFPLYLRLFFKRHSCKSCQQIHLLGWLTNRLNLNGHHDRSKVTNEIVIHRWLFQFTRTNCGLNTTIYSSALVDCSLELKYDKNSRSLCKRFHCWLIRPRWRKQTINIDSYSLSHPNGVEIIDPYKWTAFQAL